jgi:putative hemolysin
MIIEIFFIVLLILANGLFALSEIAVVSSRKTRLQEKIDRGDSGAQTALELANAPSQFLSTIQVGITLIGTMAGAYGGATIAESLAESMRAIPRLAPFSDALSIAAVVLTITYITIVFGELVPKRLALSNPESIASFVAPSMRAFSSLVSPIVLVLSASTDLILKIFSIKRSEEPTMTEEEIRIMIDLGATEGVIEEEEQDIVERVFRLGDQKAEAIMTPRSQIVWLDVNDLAEEIQKKISSGSYSFFPVCKGKLDRVLGIIQSKDILSSTLRAQKADLKSFLLPPLFVPETMRALKVLEKFKQTGIHMAIVVDEYGSVRGIVTQTDILEALVGDIPHIEELAEPQIRRREDGSWLIDGEVSIDDLKEAIQIGNFPEDEAGLYQTAGGFVMMHLEKVPATGDYFDWEQYRFEVADMDAHRVDKLLVTPLKSAGQT